MPIFKRVSRGATRAMLALGPIALLTACVGFGSGDTAPREVQVTVDAVTIAGPNGFCVEPSATRQDGDTGFVILGNCAAISGSARAPQPDVPALLTAAVAARSDGASLTDNLGALDAFFQTEDGRGLLSRSGDATSVEILETRIEDGMFFLHARDTSAGALEGVAPDYWRAYLNVGPRLATLSVLALEDRGVSDATALDLLRRFATIVANANFGLTSDPSAALLPQDATEGRTSPFTVGLFQRIFR